MKKYLFISALLVLASALVGSLHAEDDPNLTRSVVVIETNYGDITVELYADLTPITVTNFLSYVDKNFYDGLIFHRVIEDFMIQAGTYDTDLYNANPDNDPNYFESSDWTHDGLFWHEPDDPIVNEANEDLENLRGTISMARTSDPDSATSQFFINHDDNASLDKATGNDGYAVFGKVLAGMDVVDNIAAEPTMTIGGDSDYAIDDVPAEPVVIYTVTRLFAFDANSAILDEVEFLYADQDTRRTLVGQKGLLAQNIVRTFTQETFLGIEALRIEQDASKTNSVDDFSVLLAKDTDGKVWVLEYTEADETIFTAETLLEKVDPAEVDNIWVKLIGGAAAVGDSFNKTIAQDDIDIQRIEQIISLDAALPKYPEFGNEFALVKGVQGPNEVYLRHDWVYYHPSVGLVLELWNAIDDPNLINTDLFDPNVTSPDLTAAGMLDDSLLDQTRIDLTEDGWRLAWFGTTAPTFDPNHSFDFSDVPYLHAEPNDVRYYRGQGELLYSGYVMSFSAEEVLDTQCLRISESAVPEASMVSQDRWLAADPDGNGYLFRIDQDGDTVFLAEHVDEILPFTELPNIHYRMMANDFDTNTVIEIVDGERESISEMDSDSVVVRYDHDEDVNWLFYEEPVGLVLDLWGDANDLESTGFYLLDPNDMEDVHIKLKAGKYSTDQKDSFKVWGNCPDLTLNAFADSTDELIISVGPWRSGIPVAELDYSVRKNVYKYKGYPEAGQGGKVDIEIDLDEGTFEFSVTKIDLTGLDTPIVAELAVGDYHGLGIAQTPNDEPVNARFLMGVRDYVRATKFNMTTFQPDDSYKDSIKVSGQIAFANYPVDLTGIKVTYKWGSRSFSVPAGDNGFYDSNGKGKYVFKGYSGYSGYIKSAYIDVERGTFLIYIRNTYSLSTPPQDFTISFTDEDDNDFSEVLEDLRDPCPNINQSRNE